MPNNATKTLLVCGNGDALVASLSGDQYWITNQQGQSTPCPLQQACRCWMQYEQSLQTGPQTPENLALVAQSPVPPPTAVGQTWEEHTPWQQELLLKLGLTPADVDPLATKKSG